MNEITFRHVRIIRFKTTNMAAGNHFVRFHITSAVKLFQEWLINMLTTRNIEK